MKTLRLLALTALAAVSLSSCTSRTGADVGFYRYLYDTFCERMADHYRNGRYEHVYFHDMTEYFERRVGRMTVDDLKNLLGEPRIVPPDEDYYRNALAKLYGHEVVWDTHWQGGDQHDAVLHFGESGPPHGIPDESLNLFFAVKNNVVVSVWGLFP